MAVGCCSSENAVHVLKGSGHCMLSTGSVIGLIGVALLVTAVALSLLAWDGMFVYSIGVRAPLHLLWAIPVTLAFVAIDLFIILGCIKKAEQAGSCLLENLKDNGSHMIEHFSAIHIKS